MTYYYNNSPRDRYYVPRKDTDDEDDVNCVEKCSYNTTGDKSVKWSRTKLPTILIDNVLKQKSHKGGRDILFLYPHY